MTKVVCKFCKTQFTPDKPYYSVCNHCINDSAKCKTCGKIVKAENDKFECCGHVEFKPSQFSGMDLGEICHKLETGMSYSETAQFVNSYGDEE